MHTSGCKSNAGHSWREDDNWLWSVQGSPLPANSMWHLVVHRHSLCQIWRGWWTSGLNRFSATGRRCFFFSHSAWLSCHQSEAQSPSLVTLCGYCGTFGHNGTQLVLLPVASTQQNDLIALWCRNQLCSVKRIFTGTGTVGIRTRQLGHRASKLEIHAISTHTCIYSPACLANSAPVQLLACHESLLGNAVQEMGIGIPRRKLILSTYLVF